MAFQARMFISQVTQKAGVPEGREVVMSAITRGEEAKGWSKWTPSASLTMYVTNPDVVSQFEVGAEYLLTFEKVREAGGPADKAH